MQEHITWFDNETLASMNISMQVGDITYFTPTTTTAGMGTSSQSEIVKIGTIKDISLVNTAALDTTADNGLVNANEAYIDFKGDDAECGWSSGNCPNAGIIRINKSYKEAGIIPGMSIDLGVAPTIDSTGTLTGFSNSIFKSQATGSSDILFVKSVNPNGDDENEIQIAQYNVNEGNFVYSDGEAADIVPTNNNAAVDTRGLSKLKSLQYSGDTPQYKLDQQFQNRPTRVRFTFDNESGTPPLGVYPATGATYDANVGGYMSPWYGKTKFWMIVSEINDNAESANIGDFQMFSKDNAVNMVSPRGYYAEAKIVSNSTIKSEMFAVAVDGRASSK